MNSVQESKNELDAAIRYAENAISSAKQTIESMEFRQQMAQKNYQEQTGREAALQAEVNELCDVIDRMGEDSKGDSVTIKQLQNQIGELKSEGALLAERIDEMRDAAFADANTIKYLKSERSDMQDCIKLRENQIAELESKVQGQYDDIVMLEREVEKLRKEKEASSGPCGCQAYRDLEEKKSLTEHDVTVKTAQAEAWKKKYYDFKEALVKAGDPRVVEGVSGVIMNKPTMPVIPKAVAIAIFREGMQHGVEAACSEIDNTNDIEISETGYTGGFEVNFTKYFDLSEHLDTDWMRDKVGDYSEEFVTDALGNLCADNEFECRIHGIDDQEEKKND